MTKSLRWAVSLSETLASPKFEEMYRKMVLSLPEEEMAIHRRFRYKQDSLACLLSRIISRCAASSSLQIPWNEVEIQRTELGKPELKNRSGWHFNVSHHGDFVVLASSDALIGVDVMRIEPRGNDSATQHIEKMRRQFTELEIQEMKKKSTEIGKWREFYRVWCLKESILKATGIGLTDNLRKYEFRVEDKGLHEPGCFLTTTKYFYQSEFQSTWKFEESFIGEDHCVAVAVNSSEIGSDFKMLKIESLMENSCFMSGMFDDTSIVDLDAFLLKENKIFS